MNEKIESIILVVVAIISFALFVNESRLLVKTGLYIEPIRHYEIVDGEFTKIIK
jgi:hypothetical protein